MSQDSQVRAGVLDWSSRQVGEPFHRFFALTQELEQLDAFGTGDGVANARELCVQGILDLPSSPSIS